MPRRLLREVLGWPDLQPCNGWQHSEAVFPITHRAFLEPEDARSQSADHATTNATPSATITGASDAPSATTGRASVPLIVRGIAADQLAKGQVACRFEELTIDSPRNRYVRAALETVARLVSQEALTHRCRSLAHGLRLQGVVGEAPSRQQITQERFSRHDAIDQPMLAAARLAMDLALPTEDAGPHGLLDPQRCVHWLRRLYEKAIGGFYRLHLGEAEWVVSTGRPLSWPLAEATNGIAQVFPSMRTDIVIDRRDRPQRLVIDTKFTGVFTRGWYREQSLRAGYVYQLYAYLRSQEGRDDPAAPWADSAAGLLLHPAIDADVDESVSIQGHRLRFATLDLTASHADLRARLLQLACQE